MFKWFHWPNFLDTYQEWHSFVIGLADGITFQKTDWHRINDLYGLHEHMDWEFHYYKGGLIFGRLGIIAFITAMIVWII